MDIPRCEYPRPQFVRDGWLCLNGVWQFAIDQADSGFERGLLHRELDREIVVPFCPESALSGVGHTDFLHAVWYRRQVAIPGDWTGRKVLLHFQAVDYDATVWVNGVEVGRHRGGFTPFTCDLAGVALPGGPATIVVRAREPRGEPRPGGKQSNFRYDSRGALYARTTGIWQTVWLEPVPETHLDRPRITPDVAGRRFRVAVPIRGPHTGMSVRAALEDGEGRVCLAEVAADGDLTPVLDLAIAEDRTHLWGPGHPHLYGVSLELRDAGGHVLDTVRSYAGLRSVTLDGPVVRINGEAVFQRLVLDQGYYPDGLMTAPSEEALVRDIQLSFAAGFNGARLHQKVFEERFLYHADRLGYLVWGEFGDWGFRPRRAAGPEAGQDVRDGHRHQPAASLITQWMEALHRDYSHPSIIGWCPLNETAEPIEEGITALDDVTTGLYLATKGLDATRPVLDASGYAHRVRDADVYDCHDYEQDPVKFEAHHADLVSGRAFMNGPTDGRPGRSASDAPWSVPWSGQPFFVSEFGGIWWNPELRPGEDSWGYGNRPGSLEEFHRRFEGLCTALLRHPRVCGYCYTQLTDVFQEQNGLYRFDRTPKFELERLRRVQVRPAAVELGS